MPWWRIQPSTKHTACDTSSNLQEIMQSSARARNLVWKIVSHSFREIKNEQWKKNSKKRQTVLRNSLEVEDARSIRISSSSNADEIRLTHGTCSACHFTFARLMSYVCTRLHWLDFMLFNLFLFLIGWRSVCLCIDDDVVVGAVLPLLPKMNIQTHSDEHIEIRSLSNSVVCF